MARICSYWYILAKGGSLPTLWVSCQCNLKQCRGLDAFVNLEKEIKTTTCDYIQFFKVPEELYFWLPMVISHVSHPTVNNESACQQEKHAHAHIDLTWFLQK